MSYPKIYIEGGRNCPYDQIGGAQETGRHPEPQGYKGEDKARIAVLGVLANLCDRRGIKWALQDVDRAVRVDLVEDLVEIVKTVYGETK